MFYKKLHNASIFLTLALNHNAKGAFQAPISKRSPLNDGFSMFIAIFDLAGGEAAGVGPYELFNCAGS